MPFLAGGEWPSTRKPLDCMSGAKVRQTERKTPLPSSLPSFFFSWSVLLNFLLLNFHDENKERWLT